MSNSSLVTYTNITKNKTSPRTHTIDTITIHCIVGQWTAKKGCDYFATTDKKCSANYVVGKDGSIGLSVEEKDRSWCSSNSANDDRAITIEVASDTKAPYAVTDAAYNALIQLIADICKRNDIKELKWKGDKSLIGQVDKQNMTVHKWFANKDCPGEYLYERHGDIATKVNAILNPAKENVLYCVQVGAYSKKGNADAQLKKIKEAGFETNMIQVDGLWKIQLGVYSKKANADTMLAKVKTAGFKGCIVTSDQTDSKKSETKVETKVEVPAKKMEVKIGSTVKLKNGAKTFQGGKLASFVYERNHKVKEINVDRVVITYNGTVVAAVRKSDLIVVE